MAAPEISKEAIRSLRDAMQLDQTEFASRVGVTQCTVSLWERGERNPTGSARIILNTLAEKYLRKKISK